MWLAFYNPTATGDVLLLTRDSNSTSAKSFERKGDVAVVRPAHQEEIVSVNIFNASQYLDLSETGQVLLSNEQLKTINELISKTDYEAEVKVDATPKFVVGYVESCDPVEDSDHLSLTQTNVGDTTLQIVCGAKNIRQGLHVLVARPGAVMPSGLIIWPSELRGVPSYGMVCSTRELQLEGVGNTEGIWELPDHFEPGTPLDEVIAQLN
ncbi:YtpR family tRNA-binding protein [Falseniella ignava]|uniref:tRNA-binding domain-containing protein n=1 Tax=Falseniella ignava CCUG 37419 TaxID=883112 RepID=K1LAY8_9LACT|nr:DUF4479 and tRNA-binding domain-containing protein [Falseniella ignava]EKB53670.1 hypothetical protein HMPREF9707_01423 [Falseniella ignava CCUG 37419]